MRHWPVPLRVRPVGPSGPVGLVVRAVGLLVRAVGLGVRPVGLVVGAVGLLVRAVGLGVRPVARLDEQDPPPLRLLEGVVRLLLLSLGPLLVLLGLRLSGLRRLRLLPRVRALLEGIRGQQSHRRQPDGAEADDRRQPPVPPTRNLALLDECALGFVARAPVENGSGKDVVVDLVARAAAVPRRQRADNPLVRERVQDILQPLRGSPA